jgi:hypothetical protein
MGSVFSDNSRCQFRKSVSLGLAQVCTFVLRKDGDQEDRQVRSREKGNDPIASTLAPAGLGQPQLAAAPRPDDFVTRLRVPAEMIFQSNQLGFRHAGRFGGTLKSARVADRMH